MNVGIIGSGINLNRHVRILRKIQDVRIVGHCSSCVSQKNLPGSNDLDHYPDPDSLIDDSDVMIVADSGYLNYKLVVKTLRKAKHVFLYPTVVRSANDAMQLVKLAREANALLKAGNVGSINLKGLHGMITDVSGIKFIELHYYKSIRQSSSADSIPEALLINTQVVHSLVKSPVLSVKAKGLSMLSVKPEIVNARLDYNNGCAVNLTCNTVAARDDFESTIVLKDKCIKYDFISHTLTTWKIQHKISHKDSPLIIDNVEIEHTDPLFDELSGFILSAGSGSRHQTDNECGFEPFMLAERILEKVRKSVIQFT